MRINWNSKNSNGTNIREEEWLSINGDEKNINQNIDGWQKNISCVPQEVFILDDTLKKNVAFGVDEKDINNNKVFQVLDQAGLGSFVKNLEKNIF